MTIYYRVFLSWLALSPFTAMAFEYYQEPDPSLYQFNIGPLPACDYTITTASQWKNINDPAYRVICVAPGDYRSAGIINITSSGTESNRKWLRYYNSGVPDTTHAYFVPESNKARVLTVNLTNASYWIVDRLTFDGTADNGVGSSITGASQNNVFNRIEVRGYTIGLYFRDASHNNWVQNSVFYNQLKLDRAYIAISGSGAVTDPKYTKIVNNECWDVTDCIQLTSPDPGDAEEDFRGTIIYNNDMYQTGAKYTDCSGIYTPSGSCSCSENAIDLKGASDSATDPVIIAHNRMWGWRFSDKIACQDLSDAGNAIVDHWGIYNLKVEGNIFWDNSRDYLMGTSPVSNVVFYSNLFHRPGPAKPGAVQGGLAIDPLTAKNLTIKRNVFSARQGQYRALEINANASQSPTFQFIDQLLIDANNIYYSPSGFAGTASGNRYYNSQVPSWDSNPAARESTVVGSGYDNQFCTTVKRISNPTKLCFANALYSSGAAGISPPKNLRSLD